MASEALRALGLLDGATIEEVKAAYRKLARIAHPDNGGDLLAFCQLNTHYLDAAREVTSRPCPDCGGSKKVIVKKGFSTFTTICQRCNK